MNMPILNWMCCGHSLLYTFVKQSLNQYYYLCDVSVKPQEELFFLLPSSLDLDSGSRYLKAGWL